MFAMMEHFARMLDFHLLMYTVVIQTAFAPRGIFSGEKTSIIYDINILKYKIETKTHKVNLFWTKTITYQTI